MDNLTPLDARNSLLLNRQDISGTSMFTISNTFEKDHKRSMSGDHYSAAEEGLRPTNDTTTSLPSYRNLTPANMNDSRDSLVPGAAPYGNREPTLPNVGSYRGYSGAGFCKPTGQYGMYNGGGYRGF